MKPRKERNKDASLSKNKEVSKTIILKEKNMIERKYQVVCGERTVEVQARNGLYAARAAMPKLGFEVKTLKRGRGQKATLTEAGEKTYTFKSLWKKASFTMAAADSFHACEKALVQMGATLKATGKRGRPAGSKNKPKTAVETPVTEAVVTPQVTPEVTPEVQTQG